MTDALAPDEIARLRALLEEDSIKKTKMLYSHYMDTLQIDPLADLFTVDALCEFGPYGTWEGRDTIRANYRAVFADDAGNPFFAMHNTCDHFVTLTGPDTALGRSYLIDVLTARAADTMPIVWFGVYDEAYRKVEGTWQIARCSLQFLWPERHLSEGFPAAFPPR